MNKIELINNFLDNIVKKDRIPGFAVSIFNDYEIIFSNAYSNINLSVNENTTFYLGSVTKTITALAVLILDHEKKLKIDDPVKKYLKNFYFKDSTIMPEAENIITIRHLLNHTSGISNNGIQGANRGTSSLEEEILVINNSKLINIPGEKYEYCNSNYRLLGLIIEKVSGQSYEDFILENIFYPLSMNHSFFNPQSSINLVEGFGQLYGFPVRRKQSFFHGAVPSGYIISSVSDISILLMEILKSNNEEGGLFSKKLIEEMFSVPEGLNSNYAKGLIERNRQNNSYYYHTGSLENYQSIIYLDPYSNHGFVLLMNQGGLSATITFDNICYNLIKIINGEAQNNSNNLVNIILVIVTIIIILFQIFFFFLMSYWKRNIIKRRIWTKISLFMNIFWIIFFSFLFFPLMNIFSGVTATIGMYANMYPELIIILIIIVLSNLIRLIIKILVLYNKKRAHGNVIF